jgi:hypothetical protein
MMPVPEQERSADRIVSCVIVPPQDTVCELKEGRLLLSLSAAETKLILSKPSSKSTHSIAERVFFMIPPHQ